MDRVLVVLEVTITRAVGRTPLGGAIPGRCTLTVVVTSATRSPSTTP